MSRASTEVKVKALQDILFFDGCKKCTIGCHLQRQESESLKDTLSLVKFPVRRPKNKILTIVKQKPLLAKVVEKSNNVENVRTEELLKVFRKM